MSATEDALLTSLRRLDPNLSSIILQTSFVVKYHWYNDHWKKEQMEGPFVLLTTRTSGDFALCILNRASPHDTFERFSRHEFEAEFNPNKRIVLFRIRDQISSIWFSSSDANEFKRVQLCFESVMNPNIRLVPVAPAVVHPEGEKKAKTPTTTATTTAMLPTPMFTMGPDQRNGGLEDERKNGPLSLEEFRQAMLALMYDNKFIHLLHTEYLAKEEQQHSGGVPVVVKAPPPPQPPPFQPNLHVGASHLYTPFTHQHQQFMAIQFQQHQEQLHRQQHLQAQQQQHRNSPSHQHQHHHAFPQSSGHVRPPY